MSREAALAWLEEPLESAPPRLAEAVRELVAGAQPEADPGDVPGWLLAAARQELARIRAGGRDRDAALRLLAADASLTYAFEAAARSGDASRLEALAAAWGPGGRLGEELAAVTRASPGESGGEG